ncbi:MAG: hypothetical protein V3R54_05385 [Thermodesulfovibrionia bacterium]
MITKTQMTEMEKLKHLLEHWIDHNESHVKNYEEWALKADNSGENKLSEILKQIAKENKKIERLFKKALESF